MQTLHESQIDPLQSPVVQQELPGFVAAFDPEEMRRRLQATLFAESSAYHIEACARRQVYYDDEHCELRYKLEVVQVGTGQRFETLVVCRVFRHADACADYFREKLQPLAAAMRGRDEIAPFAAPVAIMAPLNLALSVFPIDGELPTLVQVTDRSRMVELFRNALPDAAGARRTIEDCRIEVGHYGRQARCVLRYSVEGHHAESTNGSGDTQTVYGKVAADGRGVFADPVIDALRAYVSGDLDGGGAPPCRFNVPRSFGYHRDLKLSLLEGIRGVPQLAQLVKARSKGREPASGSLTLEEAIDTCARIAATLHGSSIALGQPRTLDDELALLHDGCRAINRASPGLGAQLRAWLMKVEQRARATDPLALCFSHGDFTYTQLIFDGSASGLVDFDTICQAEPALDVGQFLAYARVSVPQARHKDGSPADHITRPMCTQFLNTYIETAASNGSWRAEHLRARVTLYEAISLLRLAVHSWQKLKITRLEYVLSVLSALMDLDWQ